MIEEIKVKVNGKEEKVPIGTTLLQLSKNYNNKYRFPIIIARVNNTYRELSYSINDTCEIEFFDLNSRVGNRTHIAGLTFLLLVAVKELYGEKADIIVQKKVILQLTQKGNRNLCNIPQLYSILHPVPI